MKVEIPDSCWEPAGAFERRIAELETDLSEARQLGLKWQAEAERLERERDYWKSIAANFVDEDRMKQMLAALEGK